MFAEKKKTKYSVFPSLFNKNGKAPTLYTYGSVLRLIDWLIVSQIAVLGYVATEYFKFIL